MITTWITNGILQALYDCFGEGYGFHMDAVQQGLDEPCFFVRCLSQSTEKYPGGRYYRRHLYNIQYLTDAEAPAEQINETAGKLYSCLEYITVAGNLREGTAMNWESRGGLLSFFVNYNMFVYRVKEETLMETLEVKIKER